MRVKTWDVRSHARRADAHRLGGRALLLVAIYAFTLLTIGTGGATRALTRHEVLAAEPARQVRAGGPWAVQSFAGVPRLIKPPTTSWLIAASMAAFNTEAEWAVRLPSALAGTLAAGVVAWLAARAYGRTAGVVAGLMQGSFYYVLMQARLAEADMPLCAAVTVAIACFAAGNVDGPRGRVTARWLPVLFHAATAFSFMLKGPAGPAFVLMATAGYAVWQRDRRAARFLLNPVGLAVLAVGVCAWPLAALLAEPGIGRVWWKETFGRLSGAMGDSDPFYAYAVDVPLLLLPWLPFALGGAYHAVTSGLARSPLVRLCLTWFVPGLLLLTLSAWRHKHYAIPILPPFSILAAGGLLLHLRKQLANARPRHGLAAGCVVALGVVGVGVVMTIDSLRPVRVPLAVVVVIAVVGGLGVVYAEHRRSLRAELAALFATAWAASVVALCFVLPHYDGYRGSADFGARVTDWQRRNLDRPIYLLGVGEAHVAYYLKDDLIRIDDVNALVPRLEEIDRRDAYAVTSTAGADTLAGRGAVTVIDRFDDDRRSAGAPALQFVRFTMPGPPDDGEAWDED